MSNRIFLEIEFEILNSSYWEHFKVSKDLSLYLPVDHPRRILLMSVINELQIKLEDLRNKIKDEENYKERR